jgi:hypothetical protein
LKFVTAPPICSSMGANPFEFAYALTSCRIVNGEIICAFAISLIVEIFVPITPIPISFSYVSYASLPGNRIAHSEFFYEKRR